MYHATVWGKKINAVFRGYDMSLLIHKWVGALMMAGFVIDTIYLLTRIDWRIPVKSIFGPDSLVPNLTDFKDFGKRIRWFLVWSSPRFNRWAYWEKFDYWASLLGLPLLGNHRSNADLSDRNQSLFAWLVTEYRRIAAQGRGHSGRVLYLHRSFFCRPSQTFQLPHE